ncbi:hypothetical protein ST47_g8915 [Ascochyta rabiei]|uniref:Uncharacterized protein n=1 Tax=Didymella rabiei TaxID=5454 RepID=A0A162YBA2_DIDRA|nr:hypothetical protein ST47_g8915 [Ascochyta rabiei]
MAVTKPGSNTRVLRYHQLNNATHLTIVTSASVNNGSRDEPPSPPPQPPPSPVGWNRLVSLEPLAPMDV